MSAKANLHTFVPASHVKNLAALAAVIKKIKRDAASSPNLLVNSASQLQRIK